MDWEQPEHDEKRSDFDSSEVQGLLPQEKDIKDTAVKDNDKIHKKLKLSQLGYQAQVKLDKERAKKKSSFVAQKYNQKFNPLV